jgi:hypothetical protein
MLKIVIACRRCGYERLVSRAELVNGTWRKTVCSCCKQTDESNDEREPMPAA